MVGAGDAGTDGREDGQAMKLHPRLQAYADRVDAMTLRERGMIFLAVCLVIVTFADGVFIDPLLKKQQALSLRIQQQQDEIRAMQSQLESMARARAPDSSASRKQKVNELKAQLAVLDRQIEAKQRELIPPEKMTEFLGDVLRRNRNVQLVSLRTIAPTSLAVAASGQGAAAGKAMYRHGVEMVITGQYFDLLGYMQDIEGLKVKVFWGALDLDASTYPQLTLRLSIFTLSPEKTWLVV